MEPNTRSFSITVKNSQTYQLIAAGFGKTQAWFISILQSVLLSAALDMQSKANVTVSLDSILLNISTLKLSSKITGTIVGQIALTAIAKLSYKVTSTIAWRALLSFTISLINKLTVTIAILSGLNLDIILAILNFLSDYDGETLGTLDPETLGDLDYTIA